MSSPAGPGSAAPAVTVTICLHNSRPWIAGTLASVLAQTHRDFEAVLVDDGSTDGSVELIEQQFRDDRIRIVRQPHQGIGGARATSLAHARGTYIAFLDHDDVWAPDKLSRQLQVVRARPDVSLVFSDSTLCDAGGAIVGHLSEVYDYASIEPLLEDPYRALLLRGCFIDVSSVLARRDAIAAAGGFNPRWRFVEDYDLWLRLARRHRFACIREPLVTRRLHPGQFTRAHADVALAEQCALLRPLLAPESVPRDVRVAVSGYLCGQHRACGRRLAAVRRYGAALRACAGAARYPRAFIGFLMGQVAGTRLKRPLKSAALSLRQWSSRPSPTRSLAAPVARATPFGHIWIDGSALDEAQTGFFTFSVELIRRVAHHACRAYTHVTATPRGAAALRDRLAADAALVQIHVVSPWDRWRDLVRAAMALVRPPEPSIEVVISRGRFRKPGAHRIAVVMDLTTRIHPELHTDHNIREFERYARYVARHAHQIVTISESSRRDILDRLPVYPASVVVLSMSVDRVYRGARFDAKAPARYGIVHPYVLSVGTLEPRKNLRRLVAAFATIMNAPAMRHHRLVLVGPEGWDAGFTEWVRHSPAAERVLLPGFVATADLPSLYHHADAFVYPSLYEGFGLPVLEAMWSSAAVATSRVSSLPEVLGSGGVYFDPYDVEAIATAIGRLVRMSRESKLAYRAYCRGRAQAVFDGDSGPALPGLAIDGRIACASHS